jgi:DNA mismatch repair protein MutS2
VDSFTLTKIEFDAIRCILADFCSCSLGKMLAGRIGPSRNPEVIHRWQDQTSQMVRTVREVGLPPFGGVTDISEAMRRATPGAGVSGEDFAQIAAALEGAGNIRTFLLALPEDLDKLHELASQIGTFEGEVEAIRAVVAPDGRVLDDASERLAELRGQIASVTRQIHDSIYSYLQNPEVARLLQNPTVTLHGDRYVLPVKAENRGRLPGVVHRASNTGATVFVEPNESVELNNRLADLHDDERREVQRLLGQLAVRVHARADAIESTLRILAQIDVLSAKAQYAYQFDMTCPEISERGVLQLSQARHPLLIDQAWRQEKAGLGEEKRHRVVPIDVRLGSDFDVLVITGSNTGGKTVTLKTVAVLAAMGQSGMHIPARRGATMPVFRDIFIDVGDEQSLQQSLSTFGAHTKRTKYILRKADKASLVLLDELGAGTDPDEGSAIGQAVLDEMLRIGCLGMVTTHLSALKAYAFNHDRVDNASVEFNTKTLRPTYRLRIGTPGESHAITVARQLGLPRRITTAAKSHLTNLGKQFRRAIRATAVARQSAEEARAKAQTAELAALNQQEVYQAKLADLHRLQEEFETWLASLPEWEAGQEIMVPSLNKTGRLVRLELHRQIALVECDGLQVEVPLRELIPDLGQSGVREQIASLRREILQQAAEAERTQAEARRLHEEYQRSLEQQKERARQFDAWLGAIGRMRVGQEVPIARKPGRATLVKVDLPGLRATVETRQGQMELPLQELFPQTGRFMRRAGARPARRRAPARRGAKPAAALDRPVRRRSPDSKRARENRDALLAVQPGQQVFVVPFNKRATLIRFHEERDQAVVQSGIFEMEIPLADLEPVEQKR